MLILAFIAITTPVRCIAGLLVVVGGLVPWSSVLALSGSFAHVVT
jgi:hypothetical protein